jgi:tryptophan-rich sensory protein
MVTVTPVELIISIIYAVSVAWPAALRSGTQYEYYERRMNHVKIAPKPWVFKVVWPILYGLVAATGIIHFLSKPMNVPADDYYIAIVVLFFVNITLNHLWTILFFVNKQPLLALTDAFALFFTAVVIEVLLGIEELTLPFWLYFPYTLWLFIAIILNGMWIISLSKLKEKKRKEGHHEEQDHQHSSTHQTQLTVTTTDGKIVTGGVIYSNQ